MTGSARRLGGWWRLWAVLSVTWCFLAYRGLDRPPTVADVYVGERGMGVLSAEYPFDTARFFAEVGAAAKRYVDDPAYQRLYVRIFGEDALADSAAAREALADSLKQAFNSTPPASRGTFQRFLAGELQDQRRSWWRVTLSRLLGPPLFLLIAAAVARWTWRGFRPVAE